MKRLSKENLKGWRLQNLLWEMSMHSREPVRLIEFVATRHFAAIRSRIPLDSTALKKINRVKTPHN